MSVIDVDADSPTFNTVVSTITVGSNPTDVAIFPDGGRVVVANAGSSDISVIDADNSSATYRQVTATIGTGTGSKSVAVSGDGARIYVGGDLGFVVLAANSYAVTATIGTTTGTKSLAVSPDGTMLFVLGTNGTRYFRHPAGLGVGESSGGDHRHRNGTRVSPSRPTEHCSI